MSGLFDTEGVVGILLGSKSKERIVVGSSCPMAIALALD